MATKAKEMIARLQEELAFSKAELHKVCKEYKALRACLAGIEDPEETIPALVDALAALKSWVEAETDGRDWPHPVLEQARAVLAKCRGVR